MEVYVCDRFHVIVFFKGEKGSFLKHQEYKKRRNPVLLPKCLCLFKNPWMLKQLHHTVKDPGSFYMKAKPSSSQINISHISANSW